MSNVEQLCGMVIDFINVAEFALIGTFLLMIVIFIISFILDYLKELDKGDNKQ